MANGQNAAAVINLATAVAANLARDPAVNVTAADMPDVQQAVVEAVKQNPTTANALNLESLASSRVMVGVVVAGLATIAKPFGLVLDDTQLAQWTDAANTALILAPLAYAAWGRIKGAQLPPIRWPWSKSP